MKTARILIVLLMPFTLPVMGQLCPGGGMDFTNSVTFDPAWIYGCNTGTSCNGGVAFDNRVACMPITAMDGCVPSPACGSISNNASDVWFKFYAGAATVTISCFQNTSLVLGIQAFAGGPVCGSLTDIGCALSGGPSSGVQLTLNGLLPGVFYYFRIYGSANPVSQRTGLYCFCGSTGLGNYPLLANNVSGFRGAVSGQGVNLSWDAPIVNAGGFQVEHSVNGQAFFVIGKVTGTFSLQYQYHDIKPFSGINYYRLKYTNEAGQAAYSSIISIMAAPTNNFDCIYNNGSHSIQVNTANAMTLRLGDINGRILKTYQLQPGNYNLLPDRLWSGIYFLQDTKSGIARKIIVTQ